MKKKVYSLTKKIPKGKVTTYKAIADKIGTKAYRAIGKILSVNPHKDVPCHRVVKSNREVGGFCGSSDNRRKIQLLSKEGVKIVDGKVLKEYIYK